MPLVPKLISVDFTQLFSQCHRGPLLLLTFFHSSDQMSVI